ncbi:ead/Ea22-like family protein [Klebsiella spallanzanii]|uniref:ead/Ea22-like family protein n=1 Tax=Klebsiella spallanzanii TaxID=2587528 RepID=UPI0015D5B6B2|nr:ead/Ea22-like family protein [Klebsiella spallanzanii]
MTIKNDIAELTSEKLEEIRQRYRQTEVPKCHICGAEMTIQRISASRITYGCAGAIYDETSCHYAEGRSLADDHYAESRITVVDVSDPDVLDLVEALEKAQSAGSINNQWKPDACPITGRRFFMWIEHPELGYVPTYGGPYDSYTIPTRDGDGEFSCERYDHDVGGWVDGECVGAYLIDDDEQCRVYELEQRIAELESRTVKLPQRLQPGADGYDDWYVHSDDDGEYLKFDDVLAMLTAAGIKWEAE